LFFAACQGRQYELFGQNPVVGRAAAASLMCTKYCMSIPSAFGCRVSAEQRVFSPVKIAKISDKRKSPLKAGWVKPMNWS
jgi:hypothetical protein